MLLHTVVLNEPGIFVVRVYGEGVCPIRGRPFDSEGGGGGGWHFLEINVLTLKKLE